MKLYHVKNQSILLMLLLIPFFLSCDIQNERVFVASSIAKPITAVDKEEDYSLINNPVIGQDSFSIPRLSPYYFGKFFDERVSFYILEKYPIVLSGKKYEGKLVLFFIDDILLKKKFYLNAIIVEDFIGQYYSAELMKERNEHISGLDEKRFFLLRIKKEDVHFILRKSDFNEYSIEEYHPYYSAIFNNVKRLSAVM